MTGKREVIAVADGDTLAKTAAERLLARMPPPLPSPASGGGMGGGRATIALTGGSSPEGLYRLLAQEPYRSRVPWERVHWFIGDDRFVPPDDRLSNMGMARRLFLDRVNAPAANIHPMATTAASPETAARLYETELKSFYGAERLDRARPMFDLVLMGLGSDGHTASLFPGAPALEEKEHWVVGVDKAHLAPFVPRVTLTFPALASTREMLFLVSGEDKRDILARVLAGEDLPAARAASDGELVWLVDRAAFAGRNAA
jgi:6-phosphogluconolactonase